jgi:hypothetical protein
LDGDGSNEENAIGIHNSMVVEFGERCR